MDYKLTLADTWKVFSNKIASFNISNFETVCLPFFLSKISHLEKVININRQ